VLVPTPYQIYQTYLRGPAAIIRLFEQTLGTAALCGPPAPDLHQQTISAQAAEIARLTARVAGLEAQLWEARQDTHRLQRRTAELERLISKDSHNSSRPPSSDPPWSKRTKSLRCASGKLRGGQPGHRGHTRPRTLTPTRRVVHRPSQCGHCLRPLVDGQLNGSERRQVIEIVPARLRVTEHRSEVVSCPHCGRRTKGVFPAEVRAAVQYGPSVQARALYLHDYQLLPYQRTSEAMRDLFGCQMSPGTLANGVRRCATDLIETELKIKQGLRRAAVIHVDETGLRVEKKCHYVHVASTSRLTHYGYDARRGRGAMDEIGILPAFRGTCVHDGWLSYTYYSDCRHALCGAHLLRELIYFTELGEATKAWAAPLKELLLGIKAEVEEESAHGGTRLAAQRVESLRASYDLLVAEGLNALPPPDMPEQVRRQARNLLLRLERRKAQVLRFMTDFAVPFDNNQAERDLRMVKLRQKIGSFRTGDGARHFCRVRSYISTMRKQGKGVMQALERACRGRPSSPTS